MQEAASPPRCPSSPSCARARASPRRSLASCSLGCVTHPSATEQGPTPGAPPTAPPRPSLASIHPPTDSLSGTPQPIRAPLVPRCGPTPSPSPEHLRPRGRRTPRLRPRPTPDPRRARRAQEPAEATRLRGRPGAERPRHEGDEGPRLVAGLRLPPRPPRVGAAGRVALTLRQEERVDQLAPIPQRHVAVPVPLGREDVRALLGEELRVRDEPGERGGRGWRRAGAAGELCGGAPELVADEAEIPVKRLPDDIRVQVPLAMCPPYDGV
ncbi:hypothetical protein ADJ70_07205 [Olsenella sp. oral taxon 807]|nr:hypothetical protein ADJ70_07205 [Olsenella sp. oral taxon 807]